MARKKLTMVDIRRALRKVRTKLLNGKISAEQFDMNKVCEYHRCGTVACIGGWMALELGGRANSASTKMHDAVNLDLDRVGKETVDDRGDSSNSPLYDMFYNFNDALPLSGRGITPSQGAKAITRYLDGKKPWPARRAR